VFGGHDLTLNKETGSVFIKLRFEYLSKNHQRRDFKLLIYPESTRFVVAPAFSPEFAVRSQAIKQTRLNPEIKQFSANEEQELDSQGTNSNRGRKSLQA
jgi:hypothetical protein